MADTSFTRSLLTFVSARRLESHAEPPEPDGRSAGSLWAGGAARDVITCRGESSPSFKTNCPALQITPPPPDLLSGGTVSRPFCLCVLFCFVFLGCVCVERWCGFKFWFMYWLFVIVQCLFLVGICWGGDVWSVWPIKKMAEWLAYCCCLSVSVLVHRYPSDYLPVRLSVCLCCLASCP